MKAWSIPVIWLILLTIGSLLPGKKLSDAGIPNFSHFDKVLHFVAYMGCVLWVFWANERKTLFHKKNVLYLVICLGIYGVVLEWLQQAILQDRYFEVFDIFANIMGLFAGYWISVNLLKRSKDGI